MGSPFLPMELLMNLPSVTGLTSEKGEPKLALQRR